MSKRRFSARAQTCWWLGWALVASVTAVPARGEDAPPIPRPNLAKARTGPVIRVVSGDTLIVRIDGKSMRVALDGVAASPLSLPLGKQSRDFLDNLLRGESLYIEQTGEAGAVDAFGRTAVRAFRAPDGLFVNLEVLRQGYATVAPEVSADLTTLFKYYADRARELKKGQWGAPSTDAAQGDAETDQTGSEAAAPRQQPNPAPEPAADDNVIVYKTKSGKKYHRADCYHARNTGTPITLKEARAQGLEPCSHCNPPK